MRINNFRKVSTPTKNTRCIIIIMYALVARSYDDYRIKRPTHFWNNIDERIVDVLQTTGALVERNITKAITIRFE